MMRHGEAEHNVSNTISGSNDTPSHLTEKGKEEAKEAAAQLKDKNIDVVIASPLFRTQETAEIITEELGLDASMVISDERIVETQTGLEGKPISEYRSCFENNLEKFTKACDGGETLIEMKNRVGDFLYEIHETHKDKNVLIVGHEYVAWMLDAVAAGDTPELASAKKELQDDFVVTGEVRELDFAPIPHNENFELDFHRPYIDDVMFEQNGKEMKRILDVFDTWIDSGSVPFASNHYPFEKDVFDPEKNMKFPADFISEGLDQTRGWFYSMIVLNTALFGVAPYKNVMVNGLLLAEDGRKMSKSLNNYPPMEHILENYGADALRYFLMASPLVRAESSPFSEKGVDEVMKKLLGRLDNVVTFYEMYADESIVPSDESEHVLDVWILAELRKLHAEVTTSLDSYEIDKAARPLMTFLDDLSTWYIRRSRDRFKSDDEVDKKRALETTNYVLVEYAKLLAPFTPFMADDVYMRITGNQDSVHLADWSEVKDSNENSCAEMNTLRDVVTRALEARTKTGMKVRQPLASLTLKNITFKDKVDLLEILKDELNVKEVLFDESQEEGVVLDIIITPELQAEGDAREVIRAIQQTRKQAKLSPEDEITLTVSENGKELVEQFKDEITKVANVTEFVFGDVEDGVEVKLSEMSVQFLIA
jgi:isoleucyl-tRNA synthetase